MSGPTAGILLLAALLLPALGASAGRLAGRRWGPRAASSLTLLGFGGSLGLAALLLVSGAELPSAGGWAVLLPREGPVIHALAFGAGNDQAEPQAAEAAVAAVPLVVPGPDAVVAELPSAEVSPTPTPTPVPLLPTPEPVTPTPPTDLSSTATVPPVATSVVPAVYVVQAGDTLRSIAARLRVSVEVLLAANGLTEAEGDRLGVGQELRIPVEIAAGGAPPAAPATASLARPAPSPTEPPAPTEPPPTHVPPRREPPSSEVRAYFVNPGDTLRSIAEQFGISVDALLRFNGLSPAEGDQLQLGQRLFIPATVRAPTPAIQSYIVQRGDTLRSIADQFGVGVDALLRFNGLSPVEGDQLQLGQRLYIPARE